MEKALLIASVVAASSFDMYAMFRDNPGQQQGNHARREGDRRWRPEYKRHPGQYPDQAWLREYDRERSPEYERHLYSGRNRAREWSPEYRRSSSSHPHSATGRNRAREWSLGNEYYFLDQQQGNPAGREDVGILMGGYELIKGVSELAIGSCGIITLTAGAFTPFLSGYLWYPIYNVVSTIKTPLKAYLITSSITSCIAAGAITVGSLFLLQRTGKWLTRTSLDGLCNVCKGSFHIVKGVLSWPFGHCTRRT